MSPLPSRRTLLKSTLLALPAAGLPSLAVGSEEPRFTIERTILHANRDGKSETWFHPRACMIPRSGTSPLALMTLQWIRGSDYFGPVHFRTSDDLGETWTAPQPIPALGRIPAEGHDGLTAGVCDVVPQYHPQTNTTLAMGHVVFYRGPRFSHNDQLARYPVYAVRRADGSWSERKVLQWDDPRGAFIYTNNCGQRVVEDDGDITLSFTFGPESNNRMVAGVRCRFDGESLQIQKVGPPLTLNVGRGLLEPSVAKWRERYYLTIRAEDGHGYVARSADGLNYETKQPWRWDDGSSIGMSTTQQHWLTHRNGLYLVYTRKDASNANVIRWRSPLWMAQVDPDRLCLLRDTEQTVFPIDGDGVDEPDSVPLMGNFHVTQVDDNEAWVTVGEWLPRRGARGNLLFARVRFG